MIEFIKQYLQKRLNQKKIEVTKLRWQEDQLRQALARAKAERGESDGQTQNNS